MASTRISSGRLTAGTRSAAGARGLARDFGACLNFLNASNQSVLCKDGIILSGQASYTISLWVKYPYRNVAGQVFYCERAAAGNDILKFATADTTGGGANRDKVVMLTLRDDAGTLQRIVGTKQIMGGNWHHVAVTNNAGTVQLYVDGAVDGGTTAQSPTNTYTNANIKSQIAADAGDAAQALTGSVDEMQLYTTALSATQVAQLYYRGGSISGAGLVGWYKLDENTGTSTVDSSGTQSAGTLQNTPVWSTDVARSTRIAI